MNERLQKIKEKSRLESERLLADAKETESPRATFTLSARGKVPEVPVLAFLRNDFSTVQIGAIDSLFGFVEQSTLYGGRRFVQRELSDRDVMQLNNAGIGIRLPLSNHYVEPEEYEANLPFLDKYHRSVNYVIVTNDDLARWIREDFPEYQIDASVIKNIKTHEKIDEALELYDSIVLPMRLNNDLEFLEKIESKDRITLFANAGCALSCPSKLCYPSFSKLNKGKGGKFQCSLMFKDRNLDGVVDFDLEPLIDMGFRRFKLLRALPSGVTGY
jgi:hypothetical protein